MTLESLALVKTIVPTLSFALSNMGLPVIPKLELSNSSEEPVEDLRIRVTSGHGSILEYERGIESIPAATTLVVDCDDITIDDARLVLFTERSSDFIKIEIIHKGEVLLETTERIEILPFDHWPGFNLLESLAAFSTPNHPALPEILLRASEILKKWTGNPALDAYQSQMTKRVRFQAAAIFMAIKEKGIVYAEPPASFEYGQRIRLCHTVLEQHLGTCLDLTMLYASCLEAIGLRPLVLLVPGHAFAGVWLEERCFPEILGTDATDITNRIAEGVNQITVVECNHLTNQTNTGFKKAEQAAQLHLINPDNFHYYLDIFRAHQGGIRPLPLRLAEDGRYQFEAPKVSTFRGMIAPKAPTTDTKVAEDKDIMLTKTDMWEKALLDLSLRNNLLNMKITKKLTPLASASLPELEDTFYKGRSLSIAPRPLEWLMDGKPTFEIASAVGQHMDLLISELTAGRLRSFLSEGELASTMTSMFRAAKSAIEETGSSPLYLALGALRWQKPGDDSSYFAPLILLPVELTRQFARSEYRLNLRDDDPQVNISLLELLRRDYGIDITGLEPLPRDEHGVDVQMVFNTFRQKIMQQQGWEILECAALGLFSFSQFVIWNDIRTNKDHFLRSGVVNSLVQGRLAWDAQPLRFDYQIDPLDFLLPIPTDASQLFAIKEALLGKSFVLHGPPGTGKSQTITGIIANALISGKRVLFVSEKAAALNVVEKRLKALGIGRFCLELHSNKANKTHVLGQLDLVLQERETVCPEEFKINREKTRSVRSVLDQYAAALHKPHSTGLSLRDQICQYELVKDAPNVVSIDEGLLAENPSKPDIDRRFILIERLVSAAKEIGDLASHPLRRITGGLFSHGSSSLVCSALASFKQIAQEYVEAGAAVSAAFHYKKPKTRQEWGALAGFSRELFKWRGLPAKWIAEENLAAVLRDMGKLSQQHAALEDYKQSFAAHFAPAFFDLDSADLSASWQAANATSVFKRKKAKQAVIARIQPFAAAPLGENEVAFALQTLRGYVANLETLTYHQQLLSPYLQEFISLNSLNWSELWAALETARAAEASILDPSYLMPRQIVAGNRALFSGLETFVRCNDKLLAIEQQLAGIMGNIEFSDEEDWLEGVVELCESVPNHLDLFQEWSSWGQLVLEAQGLKLESVVQALYGGFAYEEVLPSYKKSLYGALCQQSFMENSVMGTFSGATFNEAIRQYKEAELHHRKNTRYELERMLESRVPDLIEVAKVSTEAAILKRAIRSRGRRIGIRELFSQLPTLLPRLCPCMLMSPLSVAQYLDVSNEPFDLVIFDEASQLQTSKAVGALARAKAAVIVGDPQQMPPTSFFQGQLTDEAYDGLADLESILDDCLALNMPESYLEWHYRSKHESLISFSNTHFYQSKLSTFPSVDDRTSRVSYVKVLGHYDGKGENRAEAVAIVDELKRRYYASAGEALSIGVVTFNIKQQTLIEDLLHEQFLEDSLFEKWTRAGEEPLFVKNLENVQGDERDIILFSITYAPNKDDKMAMRFGPINMEGGWRRLNVAVSRARAEMKVFAVLDPDRIDLSRTGAKGVRDLKSFLEYAKKGTIELHSSSFDSVKIDEDIIAREICWHLEACGYQTIQHVGRSSFKVDIAVLDENSTNENFLAGILLDADTYAKAKTTRDRKITQPGMLEALGWATIRVWSVDWWANREKTLERVLAFLEERKQASSTVALKRVTEKTLRHTADVEAEAEADAEADA
ncbi:MAG: DUF4011 domain-containing protein, partial [Coriobacteriia bacterium]|nr:DUF4011 domain-containing protein [Coriobacteriia bacterium]